MMSWNVHKHILLRQSHHFGYFFFLNWAVLTRRSLPTDSAEALFLNSGGFFSMPSDYLESFIWILLGSGVRVLRVMRFVRWRAGQVSLHIRRGAVQVLKPEEHNGGDALRLRCCLSFVAKSKTRQMNVYVIYHLNDSSGLDWKIFFFYFVLVSFFF